MESNRGFYFFHKKEGIWEKVWQNELRSMLAKYFDSLIRLKEDNVELDLTLLQPIVGPDGYKVNDKTDFNKVLNGKVIGVAIVSDIVRQEELRKEIEVLESQGLETRELLRELLFGSKRQIHQVFNNYDEFIEKIKILNEYLKDKTEVKYEIAIQEDCVREGFDTLVSPKLLNRVKKTDKNKIYELITKKAKLDNPNSNYLFDI